MIIAPANDFVRPVHDRMPALLTPDRFDAWLREEGGLDLH
jgi:putative SOS response-associated peptidase YedK